MGRIDLGMIYIMGLSYLKRSSTQATPFSLVYGAEVMVPIEVTVPTLASKVSNNDRIYDVEAFEERE